MLTTLSDICQTSKQNIQDRCVNQQRALWLNKEGVLAIRRRKEEERLKALMEKETKNKEKEQKNLRLQGIQNQQCLDQPFHNGKAILNKACANPTCPSTSSASFVDRWVGCPICSKWFCHFKKCENILSKHIPICRTNITLDKF